ncbi:MAG: hypothetical protein M2R45_03281 [Verrucomicrobia subdivision 3 bacterium]|nr:hypothetical protein [Limisphaerales bacterium]MCS1416141.1 hypothetical protein [Limisphaerales bacterium]
MGVGKILESYLTKGLGIGSFIGRKRSFHSKSIRVASQRTSFHLLENKAIRPFFKESRIRFALNCASCPPLHSWALTADTLNDTLDQLTRNFINTNPLTIRHSRKDVIEVSEIFK